MQTIAMEVPAVVDRSPAVVDRLPEVVDRSPEVVDRLPEVVDRLPEVVDRLPEVVDRLPEVVDRLPEVVDRLPALVKVTPLVLEAPGMSTRPDDKTFLNLISRASPDPAIEFLNGVRSFSRAALDTALIRACQYGFKHLVQKLVQLGADIECRDASGKTPLLICVENGYLDLVRFLVARKADVTVVDCAGNNALILSIRFAGSKEMTQFILQQADVKIHHQNQDGCTAVMKALEVRDVGAVHLLLEGYLSERCREQSSYTDEHDIVWALLDQTINSRGQTTQQIAEQLGLGKTFVLLKECLPTDKSPVQSAVGSCDLETLNFLLDAEIETKSEINEALLNLFRKHYEREENAFTKEEVAVIKRCLECGAKANRLGYGHLMPSPVSLAVDAGDYSLVELLCKHGSPLNQQIYGSELLPLSVAAKHGRLDLMELLLQYNAEVNTNSFNNSPLDCALIHGQIDCARFIVDHGAKMNVTLALASAVKSQVPEYTKFLLQYYERDTVNYLLEEPKDGTSLLVGAVQGGNQEIIEQILQAGADINEPQSSGATPIVESKNGAVAQFLIDRGADVNDETQSSKKTPLMHVLKKLSKNTRDSCIEEVVRVLLKNGAYVNARNNKCKTPLMMAARVEGHEVILQMLLDHGADCADQDNDGNTALIHAVNSRCRDNAIFMIQNMKNKIELLNLQNNQGMTALMCGVSRLSCTVTRELACDVFRPSCTVTTELIDNGADVNIPDVNGNNVLHLGMSPLSDSQLTVLITAGCDVNHQNNEGLSPLMLAVTHGRDVCVSMLLDAGADVNAVSHKDSSKTALSFLSKHFCFYANELYCLEKILDKGAKTSYADSCLLHTTMTLRRPDLTARLIQGGLGPVNVNIDEVPFGVRHQATLPTVSPLRLALVLDNASLARYFWQHHFLTNSDLIYLSSNKSVRRYLQRNNYVECLSFLDEAFSLPMSLLKMCLLTVASAIGASPGREARVNQLPIPRVLKDTLLCKSEVASLAEAEHGDSNIATPPRQIWIQLGPEDEEEDLEPRPENWDSYLS